jgi:hypothetical protein
MSIYKEFWDAHVKRFKGGEGKEWPGDEWGNPERWEERFQRMFVPFGVSSWAQALEIGGGSGKYTEKVLDASPGVTVLNCDVSKSFLDTCRKRLASHVASERLQLFLIPGKRADELFTEIERRELVRKLDGFFSIDAMVHVDLQYLIAYLITAALTLKPGGHLILTLADATTDAGFSQLVTNLPRLYPLQGRPSFKFEFLSPDIVESLLPRLGFRIVFNERIAPGRDLFIVAELAEVALADSFRSALE